MGDVLREVMEAHPACELLVLCGHTHSRGQAQILPNPRVLTGAATHGRPAIEQILEIE